VSTEDVLKRVSEAMQIKEKDMAGKSRKQEIVEARQMLCIFAEALLDLLWRTLGFILAGETTPPFYIQ